MLNILDIELKNAINASEEKKDANYINGLICIKMVV
jgi:hypothetical protein